MQQEADVVQDLDGNAVAGAAVQVLVKATGELAKLFADDETTEVANPVYTDANGRYAWKAANGKYKSNVMIGGRVFVGKADITLFDPADDGAAGDIRFIQAGAGTVPRPVEDELRERVSVKQFGAKGDGVTDDTAAFAAMMKHIKEVGGIGTIPAEIFRCNRIDLGGGSKPWALVGAGKHATIIEHASGAGTLLYGNDGSTVPFTLSDFTVDCRYSGTSRADANHAISILDTSGTRIERVHIRDFKNCAALIFATTPGQHKDNHLIDVSADGLGVASNGMLFEDMDYCGYTRCHIKGVSKDSAVRSPGYGIQFKNVCRYGFATDCTAENCYVGFAFGNDTDSLGVQFTTASNIRALDCTNGMLASYSVGNAVSNLHIDMAQSDPAYGAEDAINLLAGCNSNTLANTVVRNVSATRSAVRVRPNSSDNHIHFAEVIGVNSTGKIAAFDAGAQYNHVCLSRMTDPRVRSAGLASMVSFGADADNNSWEYDAYPMIEAKTIAAGVVSLSNARTQAVTLDAEAAAATDDLDTITANFAPEGRQIIVRSSNDARDITIKNGTGNIALAGSDCVLGNRRSVLTLMYQSVNAKWIEVSRSINT